MGCPERVVDQRDRREGGRRGVHRRERGPVHPRVHEHADCRVDRRLRGRVQLEKKRGGVRPEQDGNRENNGQGPPHARTPFSWV